MESKEIKGLVPLILLPYQQRWLNDKSPLKIWLAGRQVGKSFSLAMEAVTEAAERKCNNLILSSSERQSKEVMQKVYCHLRYMKVRSEAVIHAERQTKEEVVLPNGSRIISLPANPDTVRGFSGNVFLDEFAFHEDSREIWKAMYPSTARGYKVRVTSTPNGKQNMFYELWAGTARGENGFSAHRTDIYDAVSEGLDVDIDALREGAGDPDSWAQEFECAFMDAATAFITYEMIASCEDEGAGKEFMVRQAHHEGHPELVEGYLGVDIGRKRDLTVFWLWEKIGDVFWTRMVHEMRGATFKEQREVLYSLMEGTHPFIPSGEGTLNSPHGRETFHNSPLGRGAGVGNVRRACIDSTGIGAQLAEEAVEKFGSRIEAVLFTGKVKEDLAISMRRAFEDRLLRIPIDRDIREDIHSVKKFTTPAGNIRFDAERTDSGHADRFWAGALGIHAASKTRACVAYEPLEKRVFPQEKSLLKFSRLEIKHETL